MTCLQSWEYDDDVVPLDTPNVSIERQFCGETVKIDVWDVQAQDGNATTSFYKNAQCALVVFDCTRIETLQDAKLHMSEINRGCPGTVKLAFVLAKSDSPKKAFDVAELTEAAKDHGVTNVFAASAKTGEGVNEVFNSLLENVVQELVKKSNAVVVGVKNTSKKGGESGGCCTIL